MNTFITCKNGACCAKKWARLAEMMQQQLLFLTFQTVDQWKESLCQIPVTCTTSWIQSADLLGENTETRALIVSCTVLKLLPVFQQWDSMQGKSFSTISLLNIFFFLLLLSAIQHLQMKQCQHNPFILFTKSQIFMTDLRIHTVWLFYSHWPFGTWSICSTPTVTLNFYNDDKGFNFD